jgi:hypothetical protein
MESERTSHLPHVDPLLCRDSVNNGRCYVMSAIYTQATIQERCFLLTRAQELYAENLALCVRGASNLR